MLIKCTDIGTPDGGNVVYINPTHISAIGITKSDQTVQNAVVIPKGAAIVWLGGRSFALSGDDLERLLQAVDIADTKVVFTRPVEDALKNIVTT